jgi:hypothetical protein
LSHCSLQSRFVSHAILSFARSNQGLSTMSLFHLLTSIKVCQPCHSFICSLQSLALNRTFMCWWICRTPRSHCVPRPSPPSITQYSSLTAPTTTHPCRSPNWTWPRYPSPTTHRHPPCYHPNRTWPVHTPPTHAVPPEGHSTHHLPPLPPSTPSPLQDMASESGWRGTLHDFFVSRVRENLHVALLLDCSDATFSVVCESNPALYVKHPTCVHGCRMRPTRDEQKKQLCVEHITSVLNTVYHRGRFLFYIASNAHTVTSISAYKLMR